MPFEDSPSLEEYAAGMPLQPPQRPAARRWVWITIGTLMLLVIVLGGVNLQRSDAFTMLAGTGTVVGEVVDEIGEPLQAYVFVIMTDLKTQTDANGRFELHGVPAGSQVVVVAYLGAGREYPVVVDADSITDMGQIQFASTRTP